MPTTFESFLLAKLPKASQTGFDLPLEALGKTNPKYAFQPHIVQWSLRCGRAGIYASYGKGKTFMQLKWADAVAKHTGDRILILAPLAVAEQTVQEGGKFGVRIEYAESGDEALKSTSPIIITNYDRLDKFEPAIEQGHFKYPALDESSILKNWTGKNKQQLCEYFKGAQFKTCYSALPAPNSPLEWQGQAEFLEIDGWDSMLTRYFVRNSMKAGDYKLKPHSARDFWLWVSSWAVCLQHPSDLGFSDEGWQLPTLNSFTHNVAVNHADTWGEQIEKNGQLQLIRSATQSATTVHVEQRRNALLLAQKAAEIVEAEPNETWQIWCFTDYESEALEECVFGLTTLKGSETRQRKKQKLVDYSNGKIQRFCTKPEIAGLGMNWQHCHKVIFIMGSSYSFEQYHQALHRNYRNGQEHEVDVHLVFAETAGNVRSTLARKQLQYEVQQQGFRQAVQTMRLVHQAGLKLDDYEPQIEMNIPNWLVNKEAA